jgi:transcriptional regulator with XRE-family HTH domain
MLLGKFFQGAWIVMAALMDLTGVGMDAKSFGLKLKQLRQAAGLTQFQLAVATGINQANISRWERGQREALVTAIPQLAVALGVEVQELFRDPEPTPDDPNEQPPADHGTRSAHDDNHRPPRLRGRKGR